MNKKAVKISLILLGIILLFMLSATIYYHIVTYDVNLDKNKLVDMNSSVEFLDANGNTIEEWSYNKTVTSVGGIPDYTLNAFVAIEDKRFYSHNGIDVKGLIRAAINNVRSFSFKEGASTISQQLIKNTHLSGEKTLKRKLSEIKLARQLESNFTKNEILEMYVNTIYFGDGCYGITSAAKDYFGVFPSELTLNQSAALAGMIKAPALYSPKISLKNCNARKNIVLKEMYEQNLITKNEYEQNINSEIVIAERKNEKESPYLSLVKKELDGILDKSEYSGAKIKVYTYYDKNLQNSVEDAIWETKTEIDKKAIILNDKNKIQAFYSTCGDLPRRLGSTLKPLAVYAPAIDMDEIDSCTKILDEKINVNGYTPSNYKDVYYGYVSAKFALAKSLNACAVKILNSCGIDKCLNYLKKADIPISDNDNALKLALGYTENGATITEIAGAYGTFVNKGFYSQPSAIRKICYENGKTLYYDEQKTAKVFGEDTAFIINDMLKSTVKEGTAKTLAALKIPLAAKTGTVGNENGNTDAYSISYNGSNILAVWVGYANSAYMDNSISGGTTPTKIGYNIWKNLLKSGYSGEDTFMTDKVIQIPIDKLSYEENNIIEKADENFPSRYVLNEYFKKTRVPKTVSKRFSNPKIENAEISLNNNKIHISLCLAEYCDFKIYRTSGNLKIQIYDSYGKKDKKQFTDNHALENTSYIYSILPYFNGKNGVIYGEEYYLNEIKTPPKLKICDDWWKNLY